MCEKKSILQNSHAARGMCKYVINCNEKDPCGETESVWQRFRLGIDE